MSDQFAPPCAVSYRLSALDAPYVFREAAENPQATVNVYFLDAARSSNGPISRQSLQRWISDRIALAPILSHRLHRWPIEIASPSWVLADDLDLDKHVFVSEVRGHGWTPLREHVTDIVMTRLDLTLPPWEVHLIHGISGVAGVPEGASALAVKIHHSACDGIAGADVARMLLSESVTGSPLAVPGEASERQSTWQAITSIRRQWREYSDARKRLKQLRAEAAAAVENGEVVAPQQTRPWTRFNGTLSPHRGIAVVAFDMQEIRNARSEVEGVTVNDVMLAVVSGAVREYLRGADEVPSDSLATLVPRSIRGLHPCRSANKVTPMIVDLHTDVDDPIVRLKAINASVALEKARKEFAPYLKSMDDAAATPGFVTRLYAWLERHSRLSTSTVQLANIAVSNYMRESPGLKLGDVSVVGIACVPLLDRANALSHMVASIGEAVTLTVSVDLAAMSDVDRYAELLVDSFAELGGEARVLR